MKRWRIKREDGLYKNGTSISGSKWNDTGILYSTKNRAQAVADRVNKYSELKCVVVCTIFQDIPIEDDMVDTEINK